MSKSNNQNSWTTANVKPVVGDSYYLVFGKLYEEHEFRVREAFWNGSQWYSVESRNDGFDNIVLCEFEELTHWREMPEPPK